MRVMVKNPEGFCEVVVIEKAAIALAGNTLLLNFGNRTCIYIDVGTNFMAHSKLNCLLENGYVDLSQFAADYKKIA